jgi:hypothetical protein
MNFGLQNKDSFIRYTIRTHIVLHSSLNYLTISSKNLPSLATELATLSGAEEQHCFKPHYCDARA